MFWWGLGRSVSEMLRCGAIWAPPSVCFERNRWPQVTPEDRAASPAPHNPLPPPHSRTTTSTFSKSKVGGKVLPLKPKCIFRECLRLELHCKVLVNGFEDPHSSRTLALSTTFNLNLLLGQRQLVCALHIKCALDCDFGAASLPHLNLGIVLCISRPLPNKTRLKFKQLFKDCWSFCHELKVLNESKYLIP